MDKMVLPSLVVIPSQKVVVIVIMSAGAQIPVSATGLANKVARLSNAHAGPVIPGTMAAHVGTEKLYSPPRGDIHDIWDPEPYRSTDRTPLLAC